MSNSSTRLVDNSTLSGVERLLGVSKTQNLLNTEHDIACFEKLISAILFSEKLYLIDDYKGFYRKRRLETFSFIDVIPLPTDRYKKLQEISANFAQQQLFQLAGSEPIGDVLTFFDQLSLAPQLRWNVWVSSQYLGLSFLIEEGEKFEVGYKTSAFSNELADIKRIEPEKTFETKIVDINHMTESNQETVQELLNRIARKNPDYSGRDHRDTLEKIVYGYGWAAERSKFYEIVARINDISLTLSPLRDAFSLSIAGTKPVRFEDVMIEKAKDIAQDAIISVSENFDMTSIYYKTPLFTAWLLTKTSNAREALDLALNLRSKEEFVQCRKQFLELEQIASNSDKKIRINKIIKEIEKTKSKILKKYCVQSSQGPTISIGVSLAGPALSGSTRFEEFFSNPFSKGSAITRFYRSLTADLIAVEQLGELHEKATALVKKHSKAGYAQFSTTPKHLKHKVTDYGRPVED